MPVEKEDGKFSLPERRGALGENAFAEEDTADLNQGVEQKIDNLVEKVATRLNRNVAEDLGYALHLYLDRPAAVKGFVNGITHHLKLSREQPDEVIETQLLSLIGTLKNKNSRSKIVRMLEKISSMADDTIVVEENSAGISSSILTSRLNADEILNKFDVVLTEAYGAREDVCTFYGKMFQELKLPLPKIAVTRSPMETVAGWYQPENDVVYVNINSEIDDIKFTVAHEYFHKIEGMVGFSYKNDLKTGKRMKLARMLLEGGATLGEKNYLLKDSDMKKGEGVLRELANYAARESVPPDEVDEKRTKQILREVIESIYDLIQKTESPASFSKAMERRLSFQSYDYRRDPYVVGATMAIIVLSANDLNLINSCRGMARHYSTTIKEIYNKMKSEKGKASITERIFGVL